MSYGGNADPNGIQVTFLDQTGSKSVKAVIAFSVPVSRIIPNIITKMNLPTTSPDGQPMSYALDHKEGGRRLLENWTLVEAGIQNGDHLIVYPEVVAGCVIDLAERLQKPCNAAGTGSGLVAWPGRPIARSGGPRRPAPDGPAVDAVATGWHGVHAPRSTRLDLTLMRGRPRPCRGCAARACTNLHASAAFETIWWRLERLWARELGLPVPGRRAIPRTSTSITFKAKACARPGKDQAGPGHRVEIKLGASYPRSIPEIRWLTPIYHPNISEIGMVCLGGYGTHWVPSVQLDELCLMLWDMVRYHNYDIRSPYNRDAALWVANQTSILFPTDPRPLRDLREAQGRIDCTGEQRETHWLGR